MEEKFKSFSDYLSCLGLEIQKYDSSVTNSITYTNGSKQKPASLQKAVKLALSTLPPKDLTLLPILINDREFTSFLMEYLPRYAVAPSEAPREISDLTLNIDISNADNIFLTDDKGYLSLVDYRIMANHLSYSDVEVISRARKVYPKYNPRSEVKMYVGEVPGYSGEFTIFNKYLPPAWRALPDTNSPPPKLFLKLVNHLWPDLEDRAFGLYWMRKSIVGRAKTFLMLCGPAGVGKNRLKLLMTAAHGPMNAVDGKKSTLTTQFNSQLSEGTILWFDELKFNESEENAMKEIPNESVSIEQKGVDATRRTELYGSYIISNNKPRDNYLSMDARKFVPLTLNTRRLEESMTMEEIETFSNKCDVEKDTFDARFVADICYYLINKCDSDKWPVDEYKSKMFYILTHTSMSRWQKRVVSILADMSYEGRELELTSVDRRAAKNFKSCKIGHIKCSSLEILFESYSKFYGSTLAFPEFSTVEAFLNYYRDLNGNKICEIQKIPGDIYGNFIIHRMDVAEVSLVIQDISEETINHMDAL